VDGMNFETSQLLGEHKVLKEHTLAAARHILVASAY
jgi:hypothetical protein